MGAIGSVGAQKQKAPHGAGLRAPSDSTERVSRACFGGGHRIRKLTIGLDSKTANRLSASQCKALRGSHILDFGGWGRLGWHLPKIETLPGATIDMVLGKDQRCRAKGAHCPDVKR